MRDRQRPPLGVLFPAAFVLFTAALVLVFRGGASANPVSRALTVLALVEDGSLRADRWFDLTIDKAIIGGHVYSDKPPLSSFVVLPFYWLWRALDRGPFTVGDVDVVVYIGDVVAAAIPFGMFVLLLQRRAATGLPAREAVWVAFLAAFGTPLLSYGSTYFGHMLSGTLFVFAYHAATGAGDARHPRRWAVAAGVLSGLGVLTDLTIWIGVVALAVFLATRPNGLHLAAYYVAGGLPCAIALTAYNVCITGSPLDWAYAHVTSAFYNPTPLRLGLSTVTVARDLLVSEYRGLLLYAPALLVLAPLAYARTAPRGRRWLLAGFTGAHFVFVASYWMWAGGWCIGPRHLTPVIMVLLYEGVGALARSAAGFRLAFACLASLGLAGNLLAVATNPRIEGSRHPFRDLYWPAFSRGEMTPDSVFHAIGLTWGRGTVYAWCVLFVVTAALLAWGAKHERARCAVS
jgi:hypothetical protein